MKVAASALFALLAPLLVSASLVDTGQCAPKQKATPKERVACPSIDFTTFFHEFSEKKAVQEAFTRFPLMYGEVDLTSDGAPFIETKIHSYDKIPVLNHDNWLIFPDEKERAIGPRGPRVLHFAIMDGFTDSADETADYSDVGKISKLVTVLLYGEESGFQVYYRFVKERDCWFLFRVDDKST